MKTTQFHTISPGLQLKFKADKPVELLWQVHENGSKDMLSYKYIEATLFICKDGISRVCGIASPSSGTLRVTNYPHAKSRLWNFNPQQYNVTRAGEEVSVSFLQKGILSMLQSPTLYLSFTPLSA
jgi:hypothetical protein